MQKRTQETSHFYIRNRDAKNHGHRVGVVAFRRTPTGVKVAFSMITPQDREKKLWSTKWGVDSAYGRTLSKKTTSFAFGESDREALNVFVEKTDEVTFMQLLAKLSLSKKFLKYYPKVDVIDHDRILQSALKDYFGEK